jgi:hypothetical protein
MIPMNAKLSLVATAGIVLFCVGADSPSSQRVAGDWRQSVKQDARLVEILGRGTVKTAGEAEYLAGLAFRDTNVTYLPQVSALLRLATADNTLGKAGEFIWEVRVLDGTSIHGLVWISAEGGRAKVLYPK